MPKGKYRRTPRPVSPEERVFLREIAKGTKRAKAFRIAFPEHPTVRRYMDAVKTDDTAYRKTVTQQVAALAKNRLQTNHIQQAMTVYQDRMNNLADKSLDVLEDILDTGRSEKVKADVALEFVRHKVGTPVQKMQVQQEQTITISFGDAHPDDVIDVQEGEVVE